MPLPKQYRTLHRALNRPTSRIETLDESSSDCFTRATAVTNHGYTYPQMVEILHKDPDLYNQIFRDSCWD